MRKDNELQELVECIDIIEYAKEELGMTVVKKGKYYSTKEHDSLMIDANRNCFWRNSNGASGSIIDFIKEFEDCNSGQAIKTALEYLHKNGKSFSINKKEKIAVKEEPIIFTLPDSNSDIKRVYAYLIKTRKISKSVVDDIIKKDLLYQDKMNNCVFVGKDTEGKKVFANLRGTNTEYKFAIDVPGSDYNTCWHYKKNLDKPTDILIVCESAIDAMSIMTLRKEEDYNIKKSIEYLSLSGVEKQLAVFKTLEASPQIKSVYIAFDNDEPGKKAMRELKAEINKLYPDITVEDRTPEVFNDWNDVLKAKVEINKGIER